MGKVKNWRMRNKSSVTSFGKITFDEEGITTVPDELTEEFLGMAGFEPVEDGQNSDQKPTKETEVVNPSEDKETAQETDESTKDKENQEESSEESEEVETEESVDFEKMTVLQLKKYAKDNDIDLGDATKKDEIISVLESAN